MKLKTAFLIAVLALPLFAQSKTPYFNHVIYYLLMSDVNGGKPDDYLLNDPAKIKAAKIKKMEVIKGKEYQISPSGGEEKGIKAINRRQVLEFDKNGNPVKFLQYSYSYGGSLTELIFTYNSNGEISGASYAQKDTTGKKIEVSGKFKFEFKSGKLTNITYENGPGEKRFTLDEKYELAYRADGTIEKITGGKIDWPKTRLKGDYKGRVGVHEAWKTYVYNYDLNGVINGLAVFDILNDTEWTMNHEFDAKGNLLSITSSDEKYIDRMTFVPGKDGFPVSAKYVYQPDEKTVMGSNYEFRYTK